MIARIINGNIIEAVAKLPSTFERNGVTLFNYDLLSMEEVYPDGWRQIYMPELSDTQMYGDLFYDSGLDIVEYTVVDKPERTDLISILTPLEFLNRFTDEEAITIVGLSKTDPNIELWWLKYNKAQDMNLDDPQTIAGVQALEMFGVLQPGRAAEILTKYPPNYGNAG